MVDLHEEKQATEPASPEEGACYVAPSLRRNAILKAILNVFNLLVPLLVGPYVNGLLHPEGLGLYYRSLSEAQVFLVIGAFGIYNYGVRELSRLRRQPGEMARVYSSLFVWGVLSNVLASLAFVVFFLLRAAPSEWAVYAVLLLQMGANIFYVEFLNEATENYLFITVKTILIRILYLVAIFVFVRKPGDVLPYAAVISLTILVNQLASFFYVRRRLRFNFRQLRLAPHFRPLLISFLLTNAELLYAQTDRVLLGYVGHYAAVPPDVTVTLYSLTFTLIGMLASVPNAFVTVAVPRLSACLAHEEEGSYQETLESTVRLYLALLLPLCVGVAVLAPEAMVIYTREVYTYAWPLLVLSCLGRIIYGLQFILCSLILYLYQAERMMSYLLLTCGVLNVFSKGALALLGQLTPTSAMLSTYVSLLLFLYLASRYAKRALGVKLPFRQKRILGYGGASLLFIPLSLLLRQLPFGLWLTTGLIIFSCAASYGLYLLLTRDPLVDRLLKRRSI